MIDESEIRERRAALIRQMKDLKARRAQMVGQQQQLNEELMQVLGDVSAVMGALQLCDSLLEAGGDEEDAGADED